MRKFTITIAALVAVLTGVACGAGNSADGDGAAIVESGEERPAASEPAEPDAAPGTRQNPLAAEIAFTVGDWTVELAPTNPDADDLVAAENQFNDPPADGRRFVIVEVTAGYAGDESGTPWIDLTIEFYGSAGNTFGTGADDFCGVIPNPLTDVGEVFPGASGTGNVCVAVPAEQIDGGAWIVEELWSLDSDRTFVALQ